MNIITDIPSSRAKFGVMVPSTNTVVEHDFNMISPPGVTFHAGRIHIKEENLSSDQAFENLLDQVRDNIEYAIDNVLTCQPEYMIMGMSAETFWGGVEGNEEFENKIKDLSKLGITTGAKATQEALDVFGAKKIAFVTPYQPVGDQQVQKFYEESGYEVLGIKGLKCKSATAISEVTERDLVNALKEIDSTEVDALVQVGTNLSMVRLADVAERWLNKPVIAINTATLWHALRNNGIDDQFEEYGTLLREY